VTVQELTLDQLGEVARGRSRHRPRDAAFLYGGPFPFVQTGDVKRAGLYLTEYEQTYSEAGLAQSRLWPAGTLCITIAANIADTAILGIDACFPDSVIGFTADPEKADARFVKYLFDAVLKMRFRSFTQGAAQDNLSQEKLLSIKFPVPELRVQQRVADIISAYDDLIENNRRRIALLEEAARTLYREWFVRFRFPGHEHVKIIDSLPEGWEVLPASEAFEVNPPTPRTNDGDVTCVPMAALSETGMMIDREQLERRSAATSVRFRAGDTLFARITPCLENGKTGFVQCLATDEVACGSTEFIVLRGRRVSNFFVYLTSRQDTFRENAIRSMIGSSGRQRVQPSCFDRYLVPIPPSVLASLFDDAVAPMFEQIAKLDQQNQKLAQARDLLLPRLMNGEIAV
jgi:type I restriction enzyme, S subunit